MEAPSSPHVRPSWDEYFMEVAEAVAKRSTCDRGRTGCVIVRSKQILVTGYAGSPPGFSHCDEAGHMMKQVTHGDGRTTSHCVRTIHAEQNAICQAAKLGVALEGGTLYCRMTPCRTCAMLLISCGISKVVCKKRYHAGEESEQMFAQAKIDVSFMDGSVEQYPNQ